MSEVAVFQPILKSKQEETDKDVVMLEAFENTNMDAPPPLFKPKKIEPFVNEEDTKRVMKSVFTAVGLMIGAMFLAFLFTWAYNKEKTLFISVYAGIMLLFCALIIIVVSIIRSKINDVAVFYVLIGSSAFFALFNIVLVIVFAIVASKRLRRSYVPSGVQEYINN